MADTSVLLHGGSGSGKTPLIGELAVDVLKRTGKRTRLYSADGGEWASINPVVKLGIVEAISCYRKPNPLEWVDAITNGKILADDDKTFILDEERNEGIGLWAFEGLTGMGNEMMLSLADEGAQGKNIGGGLGMVWSQGGTKFGSNTMAHYGIVQQRLQKAVADSKRLKGEAVIWTALTRQAQDEVGFAQVLGPQLVGKAMTADILREFVFTFALITLVGENRVAHRLYFDDYSDPSSPGAKGLANSRVPLGVELGKTFVEPASLVEAFRLIKEANEKAEEKLLGDSELVEALKRLPKLPPPPSIAAANNERRAMAAAVTPVLSGKIKGLRG